MHDSRISNLKNIKKLAPHVQTVYIKPPAKRSIVSIVRYADVSFNTEIYTIKMLSAEAQRQNKVHKIIIMIEMGDLREACLIQRDESGAWVLVRDLSSVHLGDLFRIGGYRLPTDALSLQAAAHGLAPEAVDVLLRAVTAERSNLAHPLRSLFTAPKGAVEGEPS